MLIEISYFLLSDNLLLTNFHFLCGSLRNFWGRADLCRALQSAAEHS